MKCLGLNLGVESPGLKVQGWDILQPCRWPERISWGNCEKNKKAATEMISPNLWPYTRKEYWFLFLFLFLFRIRHCWPSFYVFCCFFLFERNIAYKWGNFFRFCSKLSFCISNYETYVVGMSIETLFDMWRNAVIVTFHETYFLKYKLRQPRQCRDSCTCYIIFQNFVISSHIK